MVGIHGLCLDARGGVLIFSLSEIIFLFLIYCANVVFKGVGSADVLILGSNFGEAHIQ